MCEDESTIQVGSPWGHFREESGRGCSQGRLFSGKVSHYLWVHKLKRLRPQADLFLYLVSLKDARPSGSCLCRLPPSPSLPLHWALAEHAHLVPALGCGVAAGSRLLLPCLSVRLQATR